MHSITVRNADLIKKPRAHKKEKFRSHSTVPNRLWNNRLSKKNNCHGVKQWELHSGKEEKGE